MMNQDSAYQANGFVIGWTGGDFWAVARSANDSEYIYEGTQEDCEEFAECEAYAEGEAKAFPTSAAEKVESIENYIKDWIGTRGTANFDAVDWGHVRFMCDEALILQKEAATEDWYSNQFVTITI